MRRLTTFALAAIALAGVAGSAAADVLTLHGGAQLEGKLIEQRPDEVVFEHTVGGAHVRSVFSRQDVRKIEVDYTPKTVSTDGAAANTSSRFPELKDYKKKVTIVLDRSSSMAIGDRYLTALEEIDKLLAESEAGVNVYVFDRKPTSVTELNFVKMTDESRKKIRASLDKLGVNPQGYTDISAALLPAIAGEPEAIYLFTDGVPTIGEPSANAVWKPVRDKLNTLPPPKNVTIHTVMLSGGKYEYGDPENPDGARLILKTLSESTGGKFREVVVPARTTGKDAPLALKLQKELAPPKDPVTFHFYLTDAAGVVMQKIEDTTPPTFLAEKEFFLKEFVQENFLIEIEDPALADGTTVLEYAALPSPPRVELEVYPPEAVSKELFDEERTLAPLVATTDRNDDLSNGTFQKLSPTYSRGSVLRLFQRVHLVRGLDNRKNAMHTKDLSDRYNTFLKIHPAGGTIHVIYRRGNKSWKHTFFVDPLVSNGGATVTVTK